MRGRARLVYSAVTVGGIFAAFAAPNAAFTSNHPPHYSLRTTGPAWHPAYRINRPDGYRATLVDFAAPVPPNVAPTGAAGAKSGAISAPSPPARPAAVAAALGGVWACIRDRESGGNYAADTGNGYFGAYQFSEATWRGVGGTGYPDEAPPAIQDAMAQRLQQRAGWRQWSTHARCGV